MHGVDCAIVLATHEFRIRSIGHLGEQPIECTTLCGSIVSPMVTGGLWMSVFENSGIVALICVPRIPILIEPLPREVSGEPISMLWEPEGLVEKAVKQSGVNPFSGNPSQDWCISYGRTLIP